MNMMNHPDWINQRILPTDFKPVWGGKFPQVPSLTVSSTVDANRSRSFSVWFALWLMMICHPWFAILQISYKAPAPYLTTPTKSVVPDLQSLMIFLIGQHSDGIGVRDGGVHRSKGALLETSWGWWSSWSLLQSEVAARWGYCNSKQLPPLRTAPAWRPSGREFILRTTFWQHAMAQFYGQLLHWNGEGQQGTFGHEVIMVPERQLCLDKICQRSFNAWLEDGKLFKNIGKPPKKTPKRCFRELTLKKMSAKTLAVGVGVEGGLVLWSCLYPDFWRRWSDLTSIFIYEQLKKWPLVV